MKKVIKKAIKKLPDPLHRILSEIRQRDLRNKVKKKFIESGPKWWYEPKVFGIGLSKTGTTSLARALEYLGYKSVSWKRKERVIGWPELYHADAVTDTVCSAQFESLYYTFEKSKFIYTVREIDSWEESIRSYFQNHFGVEKPSDFRDLHTEASFWQKESGWAFHNALRAVQIRESLYARHESWKQAYSSFENRVEKFFEEKPSNTILVMDIPGGDGWDKLCSFLDCETPDVEFPHRNKS